MSHTVAQYYAALSAALRADDIEAVPGLLAKMALEHPVEAEDARSLMLLACEVES